MTQGMDMTDAKGREDLQQLQFYSLSFVPPLVLRNSLPTNLCVQAMCKSVGTDSPEFEIEAGASLEVCHISLSREKALILKARFPDEDAVSSVQVVLPKSDRYTTEVTISRSSGSDDSDDRNKTPSRVIFSVHIDPQCGKMFVDIFCAIWLVNRCGVAIDVMTSTRTRHRCSTACIDGGADEIVRCKSTHLKTSADPQDFMLLGYSGSS
jgi:hypothetical protein